MGISTLKKLIFSYLGLSIIFLIIQLILEIFINEEIKKFLTQITIFLIMLFFLKPYLTEFRKRSDKDELKLVKEQSKRKCKLFIRLGEEFDTDLFIYETVGELDERNSDLADLKVFKARIIEKIGPNVNDYYLIREAIHLKLNSGFLYFLSDISKKILVSALTVAISGLFVTRAINIIINDESKWGLLTLISQCVNFGLFTLTVIYMFHYSFKGMKYRALLLKSIVELIIKEKEKEGNKNYNILV